MKRRRGDASARGFTWSVETAEKMFELRLKHEALFKKKKQAWKDFHRILLQNGFPETLTLSQVTKKWQYTFDAYKEAKAKNHKTWLYYGIFDKYLGKAESLDKYQSWNDEWRLRLIEACQNHYEEPKSKLIEVKQWRAVETELRSSNLPSDCFIHDIRGLFHHLKRTFHRKRRLTHGKATEWPLYGAMLEYCQTREPATLDDQVTFTKGKKRKIARSELEESEGIHWTKDLTESFIQIRLQHEWLFKETKRPWKLFGNILLENGFPRISDRDVQRKWHSTYQEYQKAVASNNTSWIYYNLFQVYLGESSYHLDPLSTWQERWVISLIESRGKHDHLFDECEGLGWREVEKDLRTGGIPLDHSMLDLVDIWEHLKKTFRWKQKFAVKGILHQVWPYFNAMAEYCQNERPAPSDQPTIEFEADDGFSDEDIKPLCEVSKMKMESKWELTLVDGTGDVCRTCGGSGQASGLFENTLADKLRTIGGVKVEQSDGLPDKICHQCSDELEKAYQFRLKCQNTDKQYRQIYERIVKQESQEVTVEPDGFEGFDADFDYPKQDSDTETPKINVKNIKMERLRPKRKQKMKIQKKKPERPKKIIPIGPKVKKNYVYKRVCEVCGKSVSNMREHMNGHSNIRFSCEICNKSFKYKSGLILHKVQHSDNFAKICQICGKKFKHITQYRRHFVYHADERKFTCETCGKSFNTKDILTVHARSHTDERPFSCPECAKTFRTAGCVARHRRIVHKVVSKFFRERKLDETDMILEAMESGVIAPELGIQVSSLDNS